MSDILYPVDPGPLPPSIREMEDALIAWRTAQRAVEIDLRIRGGSKADTDRYILAEVAIAHLADRLMDARGPRTRTAAILGEECPTEVFLVAGGNQP